MDVESEADQSSNLIEILSKLKSAANSEPPRQENTCSVYENQQSSYNPHTISANRSDNHQQDILPDETNDQSQLQQYFQFQVRIMIKNYLPINYLI